MDNYRKSILTNKLYQIRVDWTGIFFIAWLTHSCFGYTKYGCKSPSKTLQSFSSRVCYDTLLAFNDLLHKFRHVMLGFDSKIILKHHFGTHYTSLTKAPYLRNFENQLEQYNVVKPSKSL